jgi:hypothetical protein
LLKFFSRILKLILNKTQHGLVIDLNSNSRAVLKSVLWQVYSACSAVFSSAGHGASWLIFYTVTIIASASVKTFSVRPVDELTHSKVAISFHVAYTLTFWEIILENIKISIIFHMQTIADFFEFQAKENLDSIF